MVIYLDQYLAAKAVPANVLKNGIYGDEISNTDRKPAVTSLPLLTVTMPEAWLEDLMTGDTGTMLATIYALATLA